MAFEPSLECISLRTIGIRGEKISSDPSKPEKFEL
jgi:hypothetical protein